MVQNKVITSWSLLAIDIENKSAYYGDSLAWPVPHNLIISELEDNHLMLEGKIRN